jgi:hypothetical protein
MQPAQLSLLPTEFPTPPRVVLAELPEAGVTEAIMLLAQLIAKAAVREGEGGDDE